MGLTNASTGTKAIDSGLEIKKKTPDEKVIALAGNPNVGKSTLFNALTGMNQHTGNWPGKTVASAQGHCKTDGGSYVFVDIPGTYSLMAHSAEEEIARNFICFGKPDAVVVVCDATCLERNLILVLQTLEITSNVIVCVNLMDEAEKKHISIDLKKLSEALGVPVVSTVARNKKSLASFCSALDNFDFNADGHKCRKITYPQTVEDAITVLLPSVEKISRGTLPSRWLALKLLDADEKLLEEINSFCGTNINENKELISALCRTREKLNEAGCDKVAFKDMSASSAIKASEEICRGIITEKSGYGKKDRRIDKVLTGKYTGYPIMLLMLAIIFFITITAANYPSQLLSAVFSKAEVYLNSLFFVWGAPEWLTGLLISGVFRVLTWVIAVMLPPMAIFFPLFTLLEDAGFLPRIAYNLDRHFKRCNACEKQALTMCMGLGCNAAGVTGCRIIDSPRERLLAILTNNFVPCNGRFPTLIAILTMFFVTTAAGAASSLLSAMLLTGVILVSILVTFLSTKLLSSTFLKGVPSSFTLELPPYRRPLIGRVIVRSIFDRTLFVLGRAIAVAAPAGAVIWFAANISVGGQSVLSICAEFLDPFARIMGLDGVILIAFILGFPAIEIVIPIIIMAYMSGSSLTDFSSLVELKQLFVDNGWTVTTVVSMMLFSLMHWPCSTTLLTIKKETGSPKWTALAFILPTLTGIIICMLFNAAVQLFT